MSGNHKTLHVLGLCLNASLKSKSMKLLLLVQKCLHLIFKMTVFRYAEMVKSENKIRHVLEVHVVEARALAGKDIEGKKGRGYVMNVMR